MAPTTRGAVAPARFEGFADTGMRFFHDLDAEQDRAWFAEHRRVYEEGWERPMHALLDEVRGRLAGEYKGFKIRAPKVFRLHRDVRFSLDKRPFKTHVAGVLALEGRPGLHEAPAVLYLQLGLEVLAGAGMYALAGPALSRYRAAVLDARSGGAVARAVAELEAAGFTLSAMETLKSAPRGVSRDHVRIGLLQRKGLVAMFPRLPTESLGSRSFADWITARAAEAAPLTRWLAKHAG